MPEETSDLSGARRSLAKDIAAGPFSHLPIEITVSVGRTRRPVREILSLARDSVLSLDRKIDDPVELYVGDRLIARGELVEPADGPPGQLAVRLTEVADNPGDV